MIGHTAGIDHIYVCTPAGMALSQHPASSICLDREEDSEEVELYTPVYRMKPCARMVLQSYETTAGCLTGQSRNFETSGNVGPHRSL